MSLPTNIWRGWRPGEFQVHFIHTGIAESIFLIFPDSTTMLLDCGDQASITRPLSVPAVPGPERLAGEWVARYVWRVSPNGRDVDWCVITHFHSDHAGTPRWQKYPGVASPFPGAREPCGPVGGCARSGIGLAAEFLRFRRATDRGWPSYTDPTPIVRDGQKQEDTVTHVRDVWEALLRRDGLALEAFRLGAADQFVTERGEAPGFSVRNVCANGRMVRPDGSIDGLYADWIARERPDAINENALSLGMVFSYGPFRLFLGGDFSADCTDADGHPVKIEDSLGEYVGRCDVAKVNHHGHHTTSRAFFSALRPRVWTTCVWDQLHLTEDTVEAMLVPGAPDSEQPLLVPTVLPVTPAGERPWWRLVPEPCRTGCHAVVTVPRGGETFTLSLIDARDEDMRVTFEREFQSGR